MPRSENEMRQRTRKKNLKQANSAQMIETTTTRSDNSIHRDTTAVSLKQNTKKTKITNRREKCAANTHTKI